MPRDVRLGPRSRLPKHMVPGKYPRALLHMCNEGLVRGLKPFEKVHKRAGRG